MRFIPSKTHGVLDYLVGVFVIASPWILGFHRGGLETTIPVLIGIINILYSLFTRYEFGVVRVIPMPVHLMMDLLSGFMLAISPWLFGFSDIVYIPHVIMGAIEIIASLMSKKESRAFVPGI